jgi:hypothetical protein
LQLKQRNTRTSGRCWTLGSLPTNFIAAAHGSQTGGWTTLAGDMQQKIRLIERGPAPPDPMPN